MQKRLRLSHYAWHVVGFLIISFALLISAARLSTPYLNRHYSGLQFFLESQLKIPIKTNRISFYWQGSLFVASLNQIEIYDENNVELIALADSVQLFVHPLKSLLAGKIHFKEIVVHGLHASVQQNEAGTYEVKGFSFHPALMQEGGASTVIQSLLARWPVDGIKFFNTNTHIINNTGDSWPLSDVNIQIKTASHYLLLSALATMLDGNDPSHIAIHAKLDLQDSLQKVLLHTSVYRLPVSSLPFPTLLDPLFAELQGHASFQSWMTFDQNTVKDMTVQFYLDRVGAKEAPAGQQTHQLSGLFQYEMTAPQQWRVSAKNIKLDDQDGFIFQLEKPSENEQLSFKIKDFALQPWWLLLNQYDLLTGLIPDQLKSRSITGDLLYAEGKVTPAIENKDWRYEVNAAFTQLTIGQLEDLAGISNLNVLVNLDHMGGFAHILSEKSLISYANLSQQALLLTDISLPISWFRGQDGWLIQSNALSAKLDNQSLIAYLNVPIPKEGSIQPDIAWYGSQLSVDRMRDALPTTPLEGTKSLEWIKNTTIQGVFSQINGFYRGSLADFPFSTHQGRFEASVKAQDVYFDYDPAWPPLTETDLMITLENQSANFELLEGMIAKSPIQKASAHIPDIEKPVLQIDGEVRSDFGNVFSVLQHSKILSEEDILALDLQGEVDLILGLTIPIGNEDPVQVLGSVATQDATYKLAPIGLVISNITGQAEFDNERLKTTQLQGMFLGQSVIGHVDLSYPEDAYTFKIGGQSIFLTETVFDWLGYHSREWIQGQSPYTFEWQKRGGKGVKTTERLSFQTPLSEVELRGPSPFAKSKGEDLPLKAQFIWDDNQTVRLEVSGDKLSSVFKWVEANKQWDLLGGQFIVGTDQIAQYPKTDKLDVVMQLPAADCVTWYDFGQQVGLGTLVTSAVQQVEFDLDVAKLSCFLDFDTVQLIGSQSAQELKATLIGDKISGTVVQPLHSWQDVIQIKLDKLVLEPKADFNRQETQEVKLTRAYQLGIKEFIWASKVIQNVELEGEPFAEGFRIKHFQANSYQTQFNATGLWAYDPRQTQVMGKITSPNIGQFVQAWAIPGSIRSGQSEIPFDVTWVGNPWQFDLARLSGKVDLDMKSGQIVGVEPGIGRVLSLFNLDTIKRRLQLDFNDLFKEGLAFDSLKANSLLEEGRVSTNNLQLKAPSSTIGGDLVLDWPKDQVSGTLYVSPNISGSIPVAAAIAAGNPAVGAAFWAFGKLMSKKSVVTTTPTGRYVYQVSGTLSNPVIIEKDAKTIQ